MEQMSSGCPGHAKAVPVSFFLNPEHWRFALILFV